MKKIILVLLLISSFSWGLAAQKQPIMLGGSLSVGYSGFSGSWKATTNGQTTLEWTDLSGGTIPISLMGYFTVGVNDLLSVGAMAGFNIAVNNYLGTPNYTVDGTTPVALVESTAAGIRLGPYFRLGLWGKDRGGGLGLGAFFAADFYSQDRRYFIDFGGGVKYYLSQNGLVGLGAGLLVDVFITRYFGFNAGLIFSGLLSEGFVEGFSGSTLRISGSGIGFFAGVSFSVPLGKGK